MDLHFNSALAARFSSASQIARVLSEDWFGREGYCLSCLNRPVARLTNNTKVKDFTCERCAEDFQLKSSSRPFRARVQDGDYGTFRQAVEEGKAPNLLLLHYRRPELDVLDLYGVHRRMLSPLSIIVRNPLSVTAERYPWVGCDIDLRTLPAEALVPVVTRGTEIPEQDVQARWRRYESLDERHGDKGWLRDVLACVEKTKKEVFRNEDLYSFETDLSLLHPTNRNIRPKIRQQLQVLCAEGLLRRVEPGLYRRRST